MADETNSYSSATSTPPRRSRWPWVMTGLFAAFSGGLIANPWFEREVRSRLPEALQEKTPASVQAGASADVAALAQRLAAVEARPAAEIPGDLSGRIAALEASRAVAGVSGPAALADTSAIDSRVAVIEGRIATTEAAAQSAAQAANAAQATFMTLDSRLNAATAKLDRDGTALRAMASAMALRGVVDRGAPMGTLDDSLALLVGGQSPDMLTLRRVERGGPTLASLRSSFRSVRPALLQTAEAASGNWTDRALVQVKALLDVRPADGSARNPTNQTPDAMIPLVDERLARGDVAGAIAAMRLLPASAQNRAGGWLTQASLYVQTRAALARLETQAITAATQIAAAPALPTVPVAPAPVVPPPASMGGGNVPAPVQ
jgi:hypothetical protein